MTASPRIESIKPAAALPGGEVAIHGSGFGTRNHARPLVQFGAAEASLVLAAENLLIARVPEGAAGGTVRVRMAGVESPPYPLALGTQVADNLHPVASPAVDADGNVYVTFSGQRGQKVPVSLYKVTANHVIKPFITEMMNPTGMAIDSEGFLFVSSRHDGAIHRVSPDGRAMQWIEGMGIATGLAFDKAGNLYVGDRSGTIFKIGADREIFVFATLEPSMAAYHLAFSPADELYVTGPTTIDGLNYRLDTTFSGTEGFRDLPNRDYEVRPEFSWHVNDHTYTFALDARHIEQTPDSYGLIYLNGSPITGVPNTAK